MLRPHLLASRQISNCPCYLEYSVICPGRECQSRHSGLEQLRPHLVDGTKFLDLSRFHVCIAEHSSHPVKSFFLNEPCLRDAATNILRTFPFSTRRKIRVMNCRYFDMNVNAIQQGSRNLAHIFLNLRRRTRAFLRGIPKVAAGTGVHCLSVKYA